MLFWRLRSPVTGYRCDECVISKEIHSLLGRFKFAKYGRYALCGNMKCVNGIRFDVIFCG